MPASAAVDAYIAAAPPVRAERLSALRAAIRAIAPDIAESMEWKMPVFRRGERYVALASQKSYLSVYLGCEADAAQVAAAVPGLKRGKACLNIGDRLPLPLAALEAAFRKRLLD